MPLTARQAEQAKPEEKAYKVSDGGGLHLLVKPKVVRYWCDKYRMGSPLNRNSPTGGLQEVDQGAADARLLAAGWVALYGSAG
jgi:hypothetical protein